MVNLDNDMIVPPGKRAAEKVMGKPISDVHAIPVPKSQSTILTFHLKFPFPVPSMALFDDEEFIVFQHTYRPESTIPESIFDRSLAYLPALALCALAKAQALRGDQSGKPT